MYLFSWQWYSSMFPKFFWALFLFLFFFYFRVNFLESFQMCYSLVNANKIIESWQLLSNYQGFDIHIYRFSRKLSSISKNTIYSMNLRADNWMKPSLKSWRDTKFILKLSRNDQKWTLHSRSHNINIQLQLTF